MDRHATPDDQPLRDRTVIYVLGGPGAGKGTQCAKIVQQFPQVAHLSAGDLLREERNRPGSPYGGLINECIAEGKIVPYQITIQLLRHAMMKCSSSIFLIDGFPRAIDQGMAFERTVCPGAALIFYECPEEILEERLIRRGRSSGRIDDNVESIRKRFKTFVESTIPVLSYFEQRGIVQIIDSSGPLDEVFSKSKKAIEEILRQVT